MIEIRFIVIDLDTDDELMRVDLANCSEYDNDDWQRCIADSLDNQPNILVLFDEDIYYDFDRLHQCLKVCQDGHVEDTRSIKYTYIFHIEKTLGDSKEVVSLGYKEYEFDNELSIEDIEELKVAVGATRVESKHGKYPSDDELFTLEGKLDLVKGDDNDK